jgi:hypothetical protein
MRRWIAVFALVAIGPMFAFGQGRIDQIRRDANGTSTDKKEDNESDDSCPNDSSSGDDSGFDFLRELYLGVILSPFRAPHLALEGDSPSKAYFPDYPYFKSQPGHLYFPEHDNSATAQDESIRLRKWSLRLSGEEGNDFRGMNRVGIRASLDTSSRFGLQSSWNFLSELLPGDGRDTTVLGDTNITFRFAQSERAQLHTGIGLRVLTDSSATHTGFNFLYGVDFFPRKPWTVSALFDVGNAGSAFIVHGRAAIGAAWRHFDCYAGYDFMRIGSVNVQGPMLGLRFWY